MTESVTQYTWENETSRVDGPGGLLQTDVRVFEPVTGDIPQFLYGGAIKNTEQEKTLRISA